MSTESKAVTQPEAPNTTAHTAASDVEKAAYAVGYGRPPKEHQFRPGQSGNGSGRKKKEKLEDIRPLMDDILAELVKVKENGRVRTVSREEAILHAELSNALNGDPKAIEALFRRAQKCGLFSKAQPRSFFVYTERGGDDGRILRMFNAEQDALRARGEL